MDAEVGETNEIGVVLANEAGVSQEAPTSIGEKGAGSAAAAAFSASALAAILAFSLINAFSQDFSGEGGADVVGTVNGVPCLLAVSKTLKALVSVSLVLQVGTKSTASGRNILAFNMSEKKGKVFDIKLTATKSNLG